MFIDIKEIHSNCVTKPLQILNAHSCVVTIIQ